MLATRSGEASAAGVLSELPDRSALRSAPRIGLSENIRLKAEWSARDLARTTHRVVPVHWRLLARRSTAPFITIGEFVARDQVWPGGTMRETGVEALSGSTSIGASEFLEGVSARLQPEKRLMLAVLEDAVSDFQKYATATSGRGRRLFANAEVWLRSSADDQPLAFQSICQALALDPSFIRAGLQRWCAARRQEPHSSRTMLHLPFRRVSATCHTMSVGQSTANAGRARNRLGSVTH